MCLNIGQQKLAKVKLKKRTKKREKQRTSNNYETISKDIAHIIRIPEGKRDIIEKKYFE